MKYLFLVVLLFPLQLVAQSQFDYTIVVDTLKAVLKQDDFQKIDQANVHYQKADKHFQTALQNNVKINILLEEIDLGLPKKRKKKKEVKQLSFIARTYWLNAGNEYNKAFSIIFDLIIEKLKVYENNDVPEAIRARTLRYEATQLYNESKKELYEITDKHTYSQVTMKINKMLELHEVIFMKLMEALCLFVNCRHQPTIYDDHTQKDTTGTNNNLINNDNLTNNKPNPDLEKELESYQVSFKVQIIATSRPLSEKKLKSFYKRDDKVEENHNPDDNLYRYWVGSFETYANALDFNQNTGIKDSFVIAFSQNKRISISKGIEIDKKRQEIQNTLNK